MKQAKIYINKGVSFPQFSLHKIEIKRLSGHSVWKSQKKSHSTLRAKRATFTFWKKCPNKFWTGILIFFFIFSLTAWPLIRDVFFYAISLGLLVGFFMDNEITWYEALILFLWYFAYVGFMKFNEPAEDKLRALFKLPEVVRKPYYTVVKNLWKVLFFFSIKLS